MVEHSPKILASEEKATTTTINIFIPPSLQTIAVVAMADMTKTLKAMVEENRLQSVEQEMTTAEGRNVSSFPPTLINK